MTLSIGSVSNHAGAWFNGKKVTMLGNSDFIMRQEQYQDLLREARQERLLQTDEVKQSHPSQLFGWLTRLLRTKPSQPKYLPRLKRAAL